WAGALAIFERAEAQASPHPGEAWKAVLQMVRRDLAYTISDGPQRDRAGALLREDLAWQQEQSLLHPDDLSIVARKAQDERTLAYSARVAKDLPAALESLKREATLLRRLAGAEPSNAEWQRYLANNALQRSIVVGRQGDRAGSLALVQEAAAGAGALLAHDPGNALWLIGKLSTDMNLAIHYLQANDLVAAR